MSFLIDELKKAEQQHRAGLSLEKEAPAHTPAPPPSPRPPPPPPHAAPLSASSPPPPSPVVRPNPAFSPSASPAAPFSVRGLSKRIVAGMLGVILLAGLAFVASRAFQATRAGASSPSSVSPSSPSSPTPALAVSPPLRSPLQQARDSLQQGDFVQAQAAFRKIVTAKPGDIDAWHGLAEASLRLGQLEQAEEHYLHILKHVPQDIPAQDGLIEVQTTGADTRQAEVRLQALLAAHPEHAFLNYGLGNLYVARERWGEAQQAFLKAYQSDPEHPDYLFSLAVSLDYLGRLPTARQLYRLAIESAGHRPARFDRQQAARRLAALQ